MKIKKIEETAQEIQKLTKDFEYVDITILESGVVEVVLDDVEVILDPEGNVTKTNLAL